MIVGFTLGNVVGKEAQVAAFIRKVCLLDDLSIADNIAKSGEGINVFTSNVTLEMLTSQDFPNTPIEVDPPNEFIVASSVNFVVELFIGEVLHRLEPTEFLRMPLDDTRYVVPYMEQGLVRVIPEKFVDGVTGILTTGYWNDEGVWLDTETW